MERYWIVVGTAENWQVALAFGKIWGLKPDKYPVWNKVQEGDKILIYVTKPVGGVVGYGSVRTKFRQDKPLWPEEVSQNKVIWPFRFEFDVDYLLPQDKWTDSRVSTPYIAHAARTGFQVIRNDKAEEVIQLFKKPAKPPIGEPQQTTTLHDEIKNMLAKIGNLQGYLAESEYNMDGARLDVVWRRVERAVPAYVFEVQVGGDLYHALAKLKHARDIWNSKIYLVAGSEDMTRAEELLSGTFHEIKPEVKLIETQDVEKLFKMKKDYKEFEAHLGI